MGERTRQSIEAMALAPFIEVANGFLRTHFSTQRLSNRIPLAGNVYYQFGDLRVELPHCSVVVEIESGGGVTNLAKYWESIASTRLSKPVKLLHVYLQKSQNDYAAHILVWRFLNARMAEALGPRWEAQCIPVCGTVPSALGPAVDKFRSWITDSAS